MVNQEKLELLKPRRTIELILREEKDTATGKPMTCLYRVSDGKRECLPFNTSTEALIWSINTRLNQTVYRVVEMQYEDMSI